MTIQAKKTYTVTGNTFRHKDTLRAMGATWDKDGKAWTLDLSMHSKSSVQASLDHDAYRLAVNGCKFQEVK